MKLQRTLTTTGLLMLASASVAAQNPEARSDGSWISIHGTVTSAAASSFMLDYGDGLISVEMDDWDTYGDAYSLTEGDEVTVYGEVDDDLYEASKIEASSVYVEDLNSYFYASSADEEELGNWAVDTSVDAGEVTFIGEVESVNRSKGTFTIDNDLSELTVETSMLSYNPMDDEGFQQIETGDRLSIEGTIDRDFFDGRELEAESIVTLEDAVS